MVICTKPVSFCTCQVKLAELEAELIELNANSNKLQRGYSELVEFKLVLQKVQFILLLLLPNFFSSNCLILFLGNNAYIVIVSYNSICTYQTWGVRSCQEVVAVGFLR